jgi:hypothetical protein
MRLPEEKARQIGVAVEPFELLLRSGNLDD